MKTASKQPTGLSLPHQLFRSPVCLLLLRHPLLRHLLHQHLLHQHLLHQRLPLPLQFLPPASQMAGRWNNGKSTAKCGLSRTEWREYRRLTRC
jgi:hypothetical protein